MGERPSARLGGCGREVHVLLETNDGLVRALGAGIAAMTRDPFTKYLHDHIPLTRHLGVVVEHHDGASIRLVAPLAPNLNHRSTAFGGSLSAVAILSGWALLHLALREREIANRLVIQRSTVDFREPVDGDFVVTATLPPPAEWNRFLATLARHDRARVKVSGTIECPPAVGGVHEGTYVALRG